MTLDQMIAAHDDTALTALANKGLLRRALRDAEAGLAKVTARDADSATVVVEGLTLTLTAAGPRPADCPCPATGHCRHLLTAMIALRGGAAAPEASPVTALDGLLALTEAEIIKFAGADLGSALTLSTTKAAVTEDGAVISVTLPDLPAPVQFLAGRPLKEAVFKGPATRKRLAIAAALLNLRNAHGKPVDLGRLADDDAGTAPLPVAFLDEVANVLERLLLATLRGGAQLCLDQTFALAVSARAQAAPRLTGALRALVSSAEATLARDAAFDPEDFATDLAETYALVKALQASPDDPVLRGSLRRSYAPAQPFEALVLGAAAWFTPSGARGLTVYAYDTTNARWVTTGHARAGGADPGFTPRRAYDEAILGTDSARRLVGRHIQIDGPRLTHQAQLAASAIARPGGAVQWSDLQESGAIHSDWTLARADLRSRLGGGLRQNTLPAPVLLAPARIETAGFDAFEQGFRLQLRDRTGDSFMLVVDAQQESLKDWLLQIGGKLRALLCIPADGQAGLTLRPVAGLLAPQDTIQVTSFDFDTLPRAKSLMATLTNQVRPGPATATLAQSALDRTCADLIRAVVDHLSVASSTTPLPQARIAALGLRTLETAVVRFAAQKDAKSALPALYLARRLRR